MFLFPQPKTVTLLDGYSSPDLQEVHIQNNALAPQEYILRIDEYGISIEYSCDLGKHYAQLTVLQILEQSEKQVQHCCIHDFPDFEIRSVMLDLGRNHVPTLETLYHVVDLLSAAKVNQLQLYFEGFPFAYASHPKVWKNRDILTGEEIQKLDDYCKSKHIDLVPTLNAFGHMKHWLSRDEYRHLGIQPKDPKGYLMPWGYERGISTLDPENPGSWELTKSLFDDLLPYFSSDTINICCDETFELEEKRKDGKDPGKLYFDYLIRIYDYIKSQYPDKTMLFWGDIIKSHPQYIGQLPNDLYPILWQYEKDTPSLETCRVFQQAGKPFYVAASTATHVTTVGDTATMVSNTDCCTINGQKSGAIGFIMTKWQDLGGWDETCVSYPAFIYGAAKSWNCSAKHDVAMYLNHKVYHDSTGQMARIAMELGNFREFEPLCSHYNGNGIIRQLYYHQLNDEDHDLDFLQLPPYAPDYFDRVYDHVALYGKMLETVDLHCEDGSLILDEYRLLIRILLHGVMLGKYRQSGIHDRSKLWQLYDDIGTIIADYWKGWLLQNKNINFENSVYKFQELQRQYQQSLGLERVKV